MSCSRTARSWAGANEPRRLDRRCDASRRPDRIVKEKKNEFGEDLSHARNTHWAMFAEVKIDDELGVIRVTRVVNAVAPVGF